jgi:hypothetical protein
MDKIYEITNEIERHITEDPTIKNRFAKHIDCFCKMVEDYGQALQPYEQQYKEADKRYMADPKKYEKYRKPNGAIALTDICPPPKGWVKISSSDNQFLNIDWIALIFRPVEPVNPLLWFGLFGYAGIQRKPEEDEKLMCEYVRLAIVHDYNLLFHSGTPIDTRIISADYKGKWFQRDEFFKTVWYYHSQLTESAQSQLTRAFERIQDDLASKKQKNVRSKKRGKYTVELLRRVQATFDQRHDGGMDVKGAWNEAAEAFAIKSGKAAEMACHRYLKKQNK